MIPKELQERIQQEANDHVKNKFAYQLTDFGRGVECGTEQGYITGATAYVERWQQAKEALEQIKNLADQDHSIFQNGSCEHISKVAQQALNSWKEEGV